MRDVDLAISGAGAAAAVVRARHRTELSRTDKGGGDFATDVDLDAERAILDRLLAHRPDDRIVAEESGRTGRRRYGADSSTWGSGQLGVVDHDRHLDPVGAVQLGEHA